MTHRTRQGVPPGEDSLTPRPSPEAGRRTAVICDNIEDLCAAILDLDDEHCTILERRGVAIIANAARTHRRRMMAICDEPGAIVLSTGLPSNARQ